MRFINEESVCLYLEALNTYQKGEEAAVRRLEDEEDDRLLLMKDGVNRTVEDQSYRAVIRDREIGEANKLSGDLQSESSFELREPDRATVTDFDASSHV